MLGGGRRGAADLAVDVDLLGLHVRSGDIGRELPAQHPEPTGRPRTGAGAGSGPGNTAAAAGSVDPLLGKSRAGIIGTVRRIHNNSDLEVRTNPDKHELRS